MRNALRLLAALALTALLVSGCSAPQIPAEVQKAETLSNELHIISAAKHAPLEFNRFNVSLNVARFSLTLENSRWGWLRDYDTVTANYNEAITLGEAALLTARKKIDAEYSSAAAMEADLRERLDTLRQLATSINEGRLALTSISQGEVKLEEGLRNLKARRFKEARASFEIASGHADKARRALAPIAGRYADSRQIKSWRSRADETIRRSAEHGGHAIVVSKIDRKLFLYKSGRIERVFKVGIGSNGSKDKLHSGDRATPEGSYRVIRKNQKSRYYKALLLDYPNDEDRQRFASLKKKGLIPRNAGIGSLIEIHGGGSEGMTLGCVALDDRDMDILFRTVDSGTPVTIVGALDSDNTVSSIMKNRL